MVSEAFAPVRDIAWLAVLGTPVPGPAACSAVKVAAGSAFAGSADVLNRLLPAKRDSAFMGWLFQLGMCAVRGLEDADSEIGAPGSPCSALHRSSLARTGAGGLLKERERG